MHLPRKGAKAQSKVLKSNYFKLLDSIYALLGAILRLSEITYSLANSCCRSLQPKVRLCVILYPGHCARPSNSAWLPISAICEFRHAIFWGKNIRISLTFHKNRHVHVHGVTPDRRKGHQRVNKHPCNSDSLPLGVQKFKPHEHKCIMSR